MDTKRVLTDEQVRIGMEKLEKWFAEKPDYEKDAIQVLSGKDSWSPRQILETMRERVKNNDWGHKDIPEESFITLATE